MTVNRFVAFSSTFALASAAGIAREKRKLSRESNSRSSTAPEKLFAGRKIRKHASRLCRMCAKFFASL